MKNTSKLLALILAAALLTAGCAVQPQSAKPQSTQQVEVVETPAVEFTPAPAEPAPAEPTPAEPTAAPAPAEPTAAPASDSPYKYTVSFDEQRGVQRATMDTGIPNLSVYFEIPVYPQNSIAYNKINEFFVKLNDEFFSPENDTLANALELAGEPDGPEGDFFYQRNVFFYSENPKVISVSINYEWYLGGVMDSGSDSYTFSAETGEIVKLADIVDASEDEIKAALMKEVTKLDDGQGVIMLDEIDLRALDTFEFFVDKGKPFIHFDRYENAIGAYGEYEVELPFEVK